VCGQVGEDSNVSMFSALQHRGCHSPSSLPSPFDIYSKLPPASIFETHDVWRCMMMCGMVCGNVPVEKVKPESGNTGTTFLQCLHVSLPPLTAQVHPDPPWVCKKVLHRRVAVCSVPGDAAAARDGGAAGQGRDGRLQAAAAVLSHPHPAARL